MAGRIIICGAARSARRSHAQCARARAAELPDREWWKVLLSSVAGSLHATNDNPAGDDGGSNEVGNSEVVSLMNRLRAPTKSDLTRKRKIATNPPKGKRTCRGEATTDPKGVTPAQRLKEHGIA